MSSEEENETKDEAPPTPTDLAREFSDDAFREELRNAIANQEDLIAFFRKHRGAKPTLHGKVAHLLECGLEPCIVLRFMGDKPRRLPDLSSTWVTIDCERLTTRELDWLDVLLSFSCRKSLEPWPQSQALRDLIPTSAEFTNVGDFFKAMMAHIIDRDEDENVHVYSVSQLPVGRNSLVFPQVIIAEIFGFFCEK